MNDSIRPEGRLLIFAASSFGPRAATTIIARMLPQTVERLKLFVASPGDVQRERDHVVAVVDELNRGIASHAGYALEAVRWQTHARPDVGRAQQVIFNQIGDADLFVGIMWQRFGTPSGVAESGTEEEFDYALDHWERDRRPRCLFYFGRTPIVPPQNVDAAKQLLKVAEFRERIGRIALAFTYDGDAHFKDLLREHLQQILLHEFPRSRPPLDPNLEALLELEKQRCRETDVEFKTPHLLLALLGPRESLARRMFESAAAEQIEKLLDRFRAYQPRDRAGNKLHFVDFDWYDRADVQAARRHAKAGGEPLIGPRSLLLGFLDTPSNTRDVVQQTLAEPAFSRLRQVTEEWRPDAGTPGIFRSGTGDV
ncbi:MAG TPA: DUF4062 domain-containing protein [Thermoanaerobaculia bacterium]|nr:DUF4062 domain-containing protein [Thermoanaerobaculia bacterium]